MRAALRPRDCVHLVEDHGLDPAQGLARLRGEEGKSDSGVVMRMSGGVRSMRLRSSAGVSPVRTPTESSERRPASGLRRLRSMS